MENSETAISTDGFSKKPSLEEIGNEFSGLTQPKNYKQNEDPRMQNLFWQVAP